MAVSTPTCVAELAASIVSEAVALSVASQVVWMFHSASVVIRATSFLESWANWVEVHGISSGNCRRNLRDRSRYLCLGDRAADIGLHTEYMSKHLLELVCRQNCLSLLHNIAWLREDPWSIATLC